MKKFSVLLLILVPLYLGFAVSSLDKYFFVNPVDDNGYLVVRTDSRGDGTFASRRSGGRMHNGIDLFADIGAPVRAVRSGKVLAATSNHGMGTYVVLGHKNGLTTVYGHLYAFCVPQGATVRQGEIIGKVGKTGNANSRDILPHLHFEIRKDGIPQNPEEYLE